jgi:hypothetical protein
LRSTDRFSEGALEKFRARDSRPFFSGSMSSSDGLANFGLQRTSTSLRSALAAEAVIRWTDLSMILYRPVGVAELPLIARSGFRDFPPRLPEQPIFYPVLTLEYARRIARDWNTVDPQSAYAGFVTRFQIDDETAARYPVQVAGGRSHEELWVPAEDLPDFNAHLVGIIGVVEAFTGPKFTGTLDRLSQPTRYFK